MSFVPGVMYSAPDLFYDPEKVWAVRQYGLSHIYDQISSLQYWRDSCIPSVWLQDEVAHVSPLSQHHTAYSLLLCVDEYGRQRCFWSLRDQGLVLEKWTIKIKLKTIFIVLESALRFNFIMLCFIYEASWISSSGVKPSSTSKLG